MLSESAVINHLIMEKIDFRELLSRVWYVLVCASLAIVLVLAAQTFYISFQKEILTFGRLQLHYYFFGGFAGFFILLFIPRVKQNVHWLMTFTHEILHTLFAILFFRKITRFHVDDKESYVGYSGGWLGYHIITLSPYFFPLFTFILLPWRFTIDPKHSLFLAVVDVLMGITYAFHVCCWIKQTRLYQTDITGPGKVKSLLLIGSAHLFNLSLLLLTPSSGVMNALERNFVIYPQQTWVFQTISHIFG